MFRRCLLFALCLLLPLCGYAQQAAPVATATPAAVDYKALFEQANDAGRKWQLRAQLLEAENFELKHTVETLRAAPPKEKTKEKTARAKKPASLAKPHPEADRPPSDEEIAAQAQANAHTYADPAPSGTSDAKPQVNEADKTVHVRDYTRKDGTHVNAYNRRPPSQ